MKNLTHKMILAITMIIFASVIITSCNKNDVAVNTIKPNKNINVVNGRLKFNTLNTFANTIKEMKANPNLKPREVLKSMLGEGNYPF